MINEVEVKLKTNFGSYKIGAINLISGMVGESNEQLCAEEISEDEVCYIKQIAKVLIMDDIHAYLYQVQNLIGDHHDMTCYQYYFVMAETLYNDNGYLPEIEVGEFLGDLTTVDQLTVLDAFIVRVKEVLQ